MKPQYSLLTKGVHGEEGISVHDALYVSYSIMEMNDAVR